MHSPQATRGIRPESLILGLLAAFATPAMAADNWLAGEWCQADGEERMIVEEGGLGFNEHTICQWVDGMPAQGVVDTRISCANVYMSDGQPVRMDETTHRLRLTPAPDGGFTLRINDDEPSIYRRCEE